VEGLPAGSLPKSGARGCPFRRATRILYRQFSLIANPVYHEIFQSSAGKDPDLIRRHWSYGCGSRSPPPLPICTSRGVMFSSLGVVRFFASPHRTWRPYLITLIHPSKFGVVSFPPHCRDPPFVPGPDSVRTAPTICPRFFGFTFCWRASFYYSSF